MFEKEKNLFIILLTRNIYDISATIMLKYHNIRSSKDINEECAKNIHNKLYGTKYASIANVDFLNSTITRPWFHGHRHENLSFTNCTVNNIRAHNWCLYKSVINKSLVNGGKFDQTSWESVTVTDSDLSKTDFERQCFIKKSEFQNVNLQNLNANCLTISNTNFKNVDLRDAYGSYKFDKCKIIGCNFDNTTFDTLVFDKWTRLSDTTFNSAIIKNKLVAPLNIQLYLAYKGATCIPCGDTYNFIHKLFNK